MRQRRVNVLKVAKPRVDEEDEVVAASESP